MHIVYNPGYRQAMSRTSQVFGPKDPDYPPHMPTTRRVRIREALRAHPRPYHIRGAGGSGIMGGVDDSRYITTAAGFTFCRDCGALIMAGYWEQHDRMHAPVPCSRVHPGMDILCHPDGTHPWESVYPRTEDGRVS